MMSEGWHVTILGATGAVGRALLKALQERRFPIGKLSLLATENSVGESIRFAGHSLYVQNAEDFAWSEAQLAFFVAGTEASARYAEQAAQAGCLVIDSSGLFALEPDVPLVVPGVNSEVLADYRNRNIVAVANSLTAQLLTAIKPLIQQAGLSRLHVTNLLSVSAKGKAALNELAGQSARLLNGLPIDTGLLQKQLAFNLLPLVSDQQGSVQEERQLVDEVRKILHDPQLPISVACAQASVFYGHAQMVHLQTERPLSVQEALHQLSQSGTVHLTEEGEYPTPVEDASGSSHLSVGCLHNDYGIAEALQFWSVADNVHFGGAQMAVETAEHLLKEYFA